MFQTFLYARNISLVSAFAQNLKLNMVTIRSNRLERTRVVIFRAECFTTEFGSVLYIITDLEPVKLGRLCPVKSGQNGFMAGKAFGCCTVGTALRLSRFRADLVTRLNLFL